MSPLGLVIVAMMYGIYAGWLHLRIAREKKENLRLRALLDAVYGPLGKVVPSATVRFVGESHEAYTRRQRAHGKSTFGP